jgi:hypothetical protein
MIDHTKLVLELAAQFYINKDRLTVGWNDPGADVNTDELKDYPDPNHQWYHYRDEWVALSEGEKQSWVDKAETWLVDWRQQYEQLYHLLLQCGKPVFSVL